jgi:hypothetical protein
MVGQSYRFTASHRESGRMQLIEFDRYAACWHLGSLHVADLKDSNGLGAHANSILYGDTASLNQNGEHEAPRLTAARLCGRRVANVYSNQGGSASTSKPRISA